MDDAVHVDLRETSFEEWVSLVFDHPAPEGAWGEEEDDDPDTPREWYWDPALTVEADPALQVRHLTRLFREAGRLPEQFTEAQIEQAFWFMIGPGGEEHFRDLLWEADLAWHERRACIAAAYDLYEGLFTKVELDTMPFMFWDCLAHEYEFGFRIPEVDAEDARVQDAMFDTLGRILTMDHPVALHAALHGLHHLAHRNGFALIRRFLDERDGLDEDIADYARQVLRGEAM